MRRQVSSGGPRRASGQGAPRDLPSAEQTKSATVLRHLKSFRNSDTSGGGSLSPAALKQALEADGVKLLDSDFTRFLAEVDFNGGAHVSFPEFSELAKKYFANHVKSKSKLARIPRAFLMPAMLDEYAKAFCEYAGPADQIERSKLSQFFSNYNIDVPPERQQSIVAEAQMDDDRSTSIGVTEFLILVAKALNLKKRKIGPGQCDLNLLKDEGWSTVEIKRAGYECKDFVESGYELEDILLVFAASELAKAGVPLSDLLASGWDCAKGKEHGHSIWEMVQAGCSMQRIRDAGYNDVDAAAALRALGIPAVKLKASGWKLSELKKAGYSTTELRLAGYSMAALNAMQQMAVSTSADKENLVRQSSP